MNTESPPLVAPNEEMAPEAMINEGGAITQPRISEEISAELAARVGKPHLKQMCAAFGVGLLVGWILAHD